MTSPAARNTFDARPAPSYRAASLWKTARVNVRAIRKMRGTYSQRPAPVEQRRPPPVDHAAVYLPQGRAGHPR
jgi:hypothetical protein